MSFILYFSQLALILRFVIMKNLDDIKLFVGKELAQVNYIIDGALTSDNDLMNAIVFNYLKVKGKQLRPMLALISGKLLGGINDQVITASAAIEILHNASLIHDDVIDDSKERRGNPTINGLWTNHIAVLVGDFFVSKALVCAVETGNKDILKVLATLGANLSLGEINQYDVARNHTITETAYFEIINNKTASLFASCAEVGGIAAGAKKEDIEPIIEFARRLGLCFQIKDDTFDYFKDPVVGKPTGNDLREGKVTLPLIYALSLKDRPEREYMLELLNQPHYSESDIECLVEWAKDCGGIDYAYNKMHQLYQTASAILDVYGDNECTQALKSIFQYIIERNK